MRLQGDLKLYAFLTKHDALPAAAFLAKQVHGTHAVRVTPGMTPGQVAQIEADALWTTEPGLVLAVKTADCAPVLVRNREGTCVAAIHAGWRGAVAGIVAETLKKLPPFEKGGQGGFHNFQAFIGPCISQSVYEIGPEVASQIPAQFLKPGQKDRSYFDLRGLIKWQLEKLGISEISLSQRCTYSEKELYFSARRGDSGRQYSFISCT